MFIMSVVTFGLNESISTCLVLTSKTKIAVIYVKSS